MFSLKRLFRSFQYAWQGLRYVWQNEQNFRIQIGIACIVVLAMLIFHIKLGEAIILTMMIIFVLVLEVVNTIFEKMVDILKPRLHTYVAVIKDMMAAGVFIAAAGSLVVGAMVFIPYCLELIHLLQ
ncbi:MAG: diacylglycerol kinase [uncultured bacterium]|nr:MAG: diacylglycerol kinase [uncultured bacterium]